MSQRSNTSVITATITVVCAVLLLILSAIQLSSLAGDDARAGQWIGIGLQAVIGVVLLVVAGRQLAARHRGRSDR